MGICTQNLLYLIYTTASQRYSFFRTDLELMVSRNIDRQFIRNRHENKTRVRKTIPLREWQYKK